MTMKEDTTMGTVVDTIGMEETGTMMDVEGITITIGMIGITMMQNRRGVGMTHDSHHCFHASANLKMGLLIHAEHEN